MRNWSDTNPKAKLLARKRAAILGAAREMFLSQGYDGANMEAIAAAANVSIMTLYRHAESKDQLFAAVMLNACELAQEDDGNKIDIAGQTLEAVLVQVGNQFQDKLAGADTVSLFRTVMVETIRFPDLAVAAYDGLVRSWEIKLDEFLSERPEFHQVSRDTRRVLIAKFIDDLIGTDTLRAFLGLNGSSPAERNRRSALAVERLLSN